MAVLDSLIDKQDTFEIVRDQIGSILALEVANQKALATTAGEDPALWDLEIFLERANNWEKFLNDASEVPIVNVVFNSLNIDDSASVRSNRQKADGLYNIYCYAYGLSQDDDVGGGHIAGDRLAYFELHRTIRLVRNILMASQNTYLQLQGTVIERRIDAIEVFDPTFAENPVQNVVAARIGLRVLFNEFTPQSTPETLELLSVDVKRTEDGQIIAEADYDYT
jgi:hypothetical protein